MYLETCKVSRKTPGDGKLQVSLTTWRSLEGAGHALTARLQSRDAALGLYTMECTCTRSGPGGPHRHYFLQSTLFHELVPDQNVRLDLDGVALRVTVTPLRGGD
jgi:hypothetical protein